MSANNLPQAVEAAIEEEIKLRSSFCAMGMSSMSKLSLRMTLQAGARIALSTLAPQPGEGMMASYAGQLFDKMHDLHGEYEAMTKCAFLDAAQQIAALIPQLKYEVNTQVDKEPEMWSRDEVLKLAYLIVLQRRTYWYKYTNTAEAAYSHTKWLIKNGKVDEAIEKKVSSLPKFEPEQPALIPVQQEQTGEELGTLFDEKATTMCDTYGNPWPGLEREAFIATVQSLRPAHTGANEVAAKMATALETVVRGYEGDGMENMRSRDEVFYEHCKAALTLYTQSLHQ